MKNQQGGSRKTMEELQTWFRTTRIFLVGAGLGALLVFSVLPAVADTDTIRPDAVATNEAGTPVGCTSSLQYECLNEDVTEPTDPDTTTDYLQLVNTDTTHVQLSSIPDVDTVTAVTVWIYHREGGSNARSNIGLYAANETTALAGPTTLSVQTSAGWESVTYSGLSLTQADLDGMRLRYSCSKQGGGSSNDCFAYAAYVDVTYDPVIEVNVSTTGSQQNLDIGSNFSTIGGTFVIQELVSNRNVTSITIEENGSVDADDGLKNVALYYDLDTTGGDGYNCSDQSFSGNELQYGATSTGGFSGNDGTITFTDSVAITTTSTLCVYVVTDIATTTLPGQTVLVQITDPSTDVVASGTNVDITPTTTVALSGQTIIQAQDRDQVHYHWRNDDGNENDPGGATSAIGGATPYDTTYDTLAKATSTRLRLQVSNEGNKTTDATQYRLEYGRKISNCQSVDQDSSWIDVGAVGGDWDMFDSPFLTNGNDTADIAESIGGMPNANPSFLSPNGGVVENSTSQTGNITLTSTQFVELEYAIISTANATEGYTYCFRLTNAGSELETYTVYPEATILADVNVSTEGTQRPTVDIPTDNVYLGADFVLVDNIPGTTTVESITLTASGTIDLQNDIDELQLFYEYDVSDPYNCVSESYAGTEAQYGSTANGFSAAGTSTFTQSIELNVDRALCIYVEFNASSTISDAELLDIKIEDASTDVVIDSGTVSPAALVNLSGTTQFVTNSFNQVHYHWRRDNGTETGATSATNQTEDTTLENLRAGVPVRLRIGVANEGSSTTPAYQYRLEYALRVSTCGAATGWQDVGATADVFDMYNSANVTDGADTTNIAVTSGGVTNVGTTFYANNNGVKDTSSQVASLALPGKNYTDLEFAIVASTTATEGATYCFRVTDAGTPFTSGYDQYPKVQIKPKTDFYVQRGITYVSGTGATITAGTHYVAPSASTTAFIRIVGTNNTGAGTPTSTGSADDVTVYIANASDITSSVTFARPATAAGDTRVAWEIVEYVGAPGGDNEIVVRQQQFATYGTGNTTVSAPAASGVVDGNDVVVFVTGQGNPDTGTAYPLGLSTAAYATTTNIATFTRGASGNAATVSYAVVEFLGDNWKVQRAEHTYTAAGSAEPVGITAVNSLTRAFIHVQKRMASGLNNHSDFGHTVYRSGLGQLTFTLEPSAASPGSHTSVAWVIENTQSIGDTMVSTRVNGSESAGTAPKTVDRSITTTISDPQDASLFLNNYGNESGGGGNQNSFPEPMVSPRIISTTQYQLWIAEPDNDTRTWRAEIVEWPTAARDIVQNYYGFYVNNDLATPTDPWPVGPDNVGNNTPITLNDGPIEQFDEFRLRMTLQISSAAMEPGIDTFNLQYRELETTCDAVGGSAWYDVGEIGSTTALWRGTSTPLTDGAPLSTDPPGVNDLLLTAVADVAATFEEENPSALTPYVVDPGEDVEFDWVVQNYAANEKTDYCFRMIEASGTEFDDYLFYPIMRTAGYTPKLSRWQFFDDATSTTPTSPLAVEMSSPSDVIEGNIIKLRTTVAEMTGGRGEDIKFKLQFSEFPDFRDVSDVVASTTCAATATTSAQLWCYADGAGVDDGIIDSAVLSDADSCTGGSGNGCGTHNEGGATTTATTYDQPGLSVAEYEFTLKHNGARASAVYYFRLFDVTNATSVPASTTYPSLQTAGASLVFTTSGLPSGTTTEGIVTDVATASTSINFGSVPFNTEYEAGYRLNINTNATEGYQVFMIADQLPQNTYGTTLPQIVGTNAAPSGWSAGCNGLIACFGYHAGDDVLYGGSSRFAPDNSYAAISTSSYQEVVYSPVPVSEDHDIIFKAQVTEEQEPGEYVMGVSFLVVPVY